ncbi:MAG: peptidylprolyl isomerase [Bacteroidetes bacterium]|nr:MAG: peptidylprolyl isomerase [Bacteroidota bacterium]
MKVSNDKVVSIQYLATDESGNIVDSNEGQEPLEYLHGYNNILAGLEEALSGLAEKEEAKVVLKPENAYGEYDSKLVFEVEKSQFSEDAAALDIGTMVQSSDGMELIVTKMEGSKVTLDANHPLAGKTLHFNVKIQKIREATPEEIDHGHVHSHNHPHH